jgi:hypothetical protein
MDAMSENHVLLAQSLACGNVLMENATRHAMMPVISVSDRAPGSVLIKDDARWHVVYHATACLVTDAVRRLSTVATNVLQCVVNNVLRRNIVSSARMPLQWI